VAQDSSWYIGWHDGPPGWAVIGPPGSPANMKVSVQVARTADGLGVRSVLIERIDGGALSARDLRAVKLPPAWMLAKNLRFMSASDDSPLITAVGTGTKRKGDAHWKAVYDHWNEAMRVAPRAPVRWMRETWPGAPTDATMRRWIKHARVRAEFNGWRDETPSVNLRG
jgi:hypothetical protein